MNGIRILPAAVLAAAAAAAWAQTESRIDVTRTPDQVAATGMAKVTAKIVSIDAPRRTVTLQEPDGTVMDLAVGPQARNFEQLAVGDTVTIEYREALTMSLKKGSGPLSVKSRDIADRAAPGAKPGGTIGREVTIVADVIDVDARGGSVTLRGPEGRTVDLLVQDPQRLKGISKGDRVQAVYTEAVAVSVQPASAR